MKQVENNKAKIWRTVSVTLIALLISLVFKNCTVNSNNNIDKKLSDASAAINKTCPMYVDSLTRLDSTEALPNKTFQYNYTVKIDTSGMPMSEIKENVRKQILNTLKTDVSFKEVKDNDAVITYNYNNELGNFLFKFEFSPKDYK